MSNGPTAGCHQRASGFTCQSRTGARLKPGGLDGAADHSDGIKADSWTIRAAKCYRVIPRAPWEHYSSCKNDHQATPKHPFSLR